MKNSYIILIITFCFLSTVYGQDTIVAKQAKNFVGKKVVLCDRVNYGRYMNVNKDGPVRLFVGPDYPNHYFTLVFPDQDLKRFKWDPEKKMVNKRFCATGTVTMYRKKPAMIITDDSMVNAEE